MSYRFRRRMVFTAWFLLAGSGAAAMGAYHYPAVAVLLLDGVWLAATLASLWAPGQQRTLSLIVALVATVAMRRAFLQTFWAIAVVTGKIQ